MMSVTALIMDVSMSVSTPWVDTLAPVGLDTSFTQMRDGVRMPAVGSLTQPMGPSPAPPSPTSTPATRTASGRSLPRPSGGSPSTSPTLTLRATTRTANMTASPSPVRWGQRRRAIMVSFVGTSCHR